MSNIPVLRIYGPIGGLDGHCPRVPELDGVPLETLTGIKFEARVGAMTRVALEFSHMSVEIIEPCVVRGDPEQTA